MSGRLAGKTALIIGASSGLGAAIAKGLRSRGSKIKADSVHNRLDNEQATHEYVGQVYGALAIFVRADITDSEQVEAAERQCVKAFGRLDIMVNNAGISVESTHAKAMKVHETSEEDYNKTMAVNAKGIFLGCKYAIQQFMRQNPLANVAHDDLSIPSRGWIINTASVQGLVPYYGTPSYCASKGAAVMLTKQVALDYAEDRIHCNALCPGFLQTSMTQNLKSEPQVLKDISSKHLLGGMGQVDDVARMAVVLASDDVRWMTGVPVPVDGGYPLHGAVYIQSFNHSRLMLLMLYDIQIEASIGA